MIRCITWRRTKLTGSGVSENRLKVCTADPASTSYLKGPNVLTGSNKPPFTRWVEGGVRVDSDTTLGALLTLKAMAAGMCSKEKPVKWMGWCSLMST